MSAKKFEDGSFCNSSVTKRRRKSSAVASTDLDERQLQQGQNFMNQLIKDAEQALSPPGENLFLTVAPQDLVVYSGNNMINLTPLSHDDIFSPVGQTGRKGIQLFVTTHLETAQGYALCHGAGRGWVHRYVVKRPMLLIDWNFAENKDYLEGDELNAVCLATAPTVAGIHIDYGEGKNEMGVCSPSTDLDYAGSSKCLGGSNFGSFTEP